MIGVINTSPLNFSGKLGILSLLTRSFEAVRTTSIVREEVLREKTAPEHSFLKEAFGSWIKVQDPQDSFLLKHPETLSIHRGEASILALTRQFLVEKKDAVAIIDDSNARDIARILGLPVIGTAGILFLGVRQKHITHQQCRDYLKMLVMKTQFWLSAAHYAELLSKLDEIP